MRKELSALLYYSKRIFVLGPSHVVYLSGCALTTCAKYQTPLGDLVVDVEGKLNRLQSREQKANL